MLIGAIGNIVVITSGKVGVRMFALYLLPIGVLPPFQMILAWITSIFSRPLGKRFDIVRADAQEEQAIDGRISFVAG